ncbi:TPA: NAD-dependent epimerase/dehydratase family protein [Photobacterium damselae]
MNVLILGGTGAIGIYLLREFHDRGYNVDVTTRREIHNNDANINYICGNAKDINFIYDVLKKKKYDCMIDLMVYSPNEFNSRFEFFLKNVNHYIFVSTYRVFSESQNELKEESHRLLDVVSDDEYLQQDEYALNKAKQENLLRESNYKNWSIVRPSITYSTNRFQFFTYETDVILSRAKLKLPLPVPKHALDKYTTMTWAGDVAVMISRLALNKEAFGESFNVLTSESVTWRDVAKIYEHTIGLKVIEVSMDEFIPLVFNKWQLKYDRMIDRRCDNSKILKIANIEQDSITLLNNGLRRELILNAEVNRNKFYPARENGRIDNAIKIFHLNKKSNIRDKLIYLIGRLSILDNLFKKIGF